MRPAIAKVNNVYAIYQHTRLTYDEYMTQMRLLALLLRPSWISSAVVVGSAVLILGVANWSYFTYNPGLYSLFYGEAGIVTALEQSPGTITALEYEFTQNPVVYTLGVVSFALIAALIVFLSVRSIERGMAAIHTLQATSPNLKHEGQQRALIRSAIGVLWILYILFFGNFILPFCLLLSRIGAEDIGTSAGISAVIGAGLLCMLALHMHIIFARLFYLRPRVFGSQAAIAAALLD